jgi:hypothetical protein
MNVPESATPGHAWPHHRQNERARICGPAGRQTVVVALQHQAADIVEQDPNICRSSIAALA